MLEWCGEASTTVSGRLGRAVPRTPYRFFAGERLHQPASSSSSSSSSFSSSTSSLPSSSRASQWVCRVESFDETKEALKQYEVEVIEDEDDMKITLFNDTSMLDITYRESTRHVAGVEFTFIRNEDDDGTKPWRSADIDRELLRDLEHGETASFRAKYELLLRRAGQGSEDEALRAAAEAVSSSSSGAGAFPPHSTQISGQTVQLCTIPAVLTRVRAPAGTGAGAGVVGGNGGVWSVVPPSSVVVGGGSGGGGGGDCSDTSEHRLGAVVCSATLEVPEMEKKLGRGGSGQAAVADLAHTASPLCQLTLDPPLVMSAAALSAVLGRLGVDGGPELHVIKIGGGAGGGSEGGGLGGQGELARASAPASASVVHVNAGGAGLPSRQSYTEEGAAAAAAAAGSDSGGGRSCVGGGDGFYRVSRLPLRSELLNGADKADVLNAVLQTLRAEARACWLVSSAFPLPRSPPRRPFRPTVAFGSYDTCGTAASSARTVNAAHANVPMFVRLADVSGAGGCGGGDGGGGDTTPWRSMRVHVGRGRSVPGPPFEFTVDISADGSLRVSDVQWHSSGESKTDDVDNVVVCSGDVATRLLEASLQNGIVICVCEGVWGWGQMGEDLR